MAELLLLFSREVESMLKCYLALLSLLLDKKTMRSPYFNLTGPDLEGASLLRTALAIRLCDDRSLSHCAAKHWESLLNTVCNKGCSCLCPS